MTNQQKSAAKRAARGKATPADITAMAAAQTPTDGGGTLPPPQAPPLTPGQITGTDPLPPNAGKPAVQINIQTPYHKMAGYIAQAIPVGALYMHNGLPQTIEPDPETQSMVWREMTPERFATWLQYKRFVDFYKEQGKGKDRKETDFSATQARTILASDVFRKSLPICREIVNVRLPVLRKREGNQYTFAPATIGYDQEAEIFTIDSHPIDWDRAYTPESCVRTLVNWFHEFPLDGGMTPAELAVKSPSMAACVTAIIGQFLHNAIDTFPLVLINANQQGTGKTFLAKCLLSPILGGDVDVNNYIEDEGEMRKTLNSMLFDGAPYCMLDDIRRLVNNTLNRFITSVSIKDRELGTNNTFKKPNRMQFFVTGNRVKTSADVERRTMPIDLFISESPKGRNFTGKLNDDTIRSEEYITTVLNICWSLTLAWMRAGCPQYQARASFKSFDKYRDIAVNIVRHAGFADPLGQRLVFMDSGDTMASALDDLVIAIADTIEPQRWYVNGQQQVKHTGQTLRLKTEQILQIADSLYLKEEIIGGSKDPLISLGKQLAGIRALQKTDSWGRTFQIGRKEKSSGSMHVWYILTEAKHDLAALNDPSTTLTPERAENRTLAQKALQNLPVQPN